MKSSYIASFFRCFLKKNLKEHNLEKIALSSPGSLAAYISGGKWKFAKHLQLIDQLLVLANKRHIKKLIVNLPPRHGKSEFISKYFPFWYLGQNPSHRIILTCYEAHFASSWGRKVRELIQLYGKEIFNIELNPASTAANSFYLLNFDGGMECLGAGGALTGKGANCLIIDDPLKNDTEANSPTIRDNLEDWFKSTAFTRLEPDAIIILIMTRWNDDDLCGRILNSNEFLALSSENIEQILNSEKNDSEQNDSEKNKELWHQLLIPALAEADDILCRKEGEPLWKERFSISKLMDIKKTIGSYWFSALYQQNPVLAGDNVFKPEFFKYFLFENNKIKLLIAGDKVWKSFNYEQCKVFVTIDLAATISEKSDWTAALVFLLSPDKEILIFDIIKKKIEGAAHLNFIKEIDEKYCPKLIGIESVQYQIALVQMVVKAGLAIKPLKPDKDKLSRALAVAAQLESGNIYFKKNSLWLSDFEFELISFPNGANDDQVDAFSYIVQMLKSGGDSFLVGAKKTV